MSEPTPEVIEFGEWLPDLADLNNPACRAFNVVADNDGYRPMPMPQPVGPSGLPDRCTALVTAISPDGEAFAFAGTATRLYRASKSGWVDVSRPGGAYASAVPWQMVRWGDTLYAVNGFDPVQKYVLGGSSTFDDVPGLPNGLSARYICIVRDFLCLGWVSESAGNALFPYRFKWAGIGSPESWTPDPATMAGEQDIPALGEMTGLAGGQWATILGRNGWQRGDFVGPPEKFLFTVLEEETGCDCPGSVVKLDQRVIWLGPRGFRMAAGEPSQPIGASRVDNVTRKLLADPLSVRGTVLPDQNAVLWSFRSTDAQSDLNDRVVCFAWQAGDNGRWTDGAMTVECLGRAVVPATLTDDPDVAAIATDDPSVAGIPTDSSVWKGGTPFPAAVVGGTLCSLQADAAVAIILDTQEKTLAQPGRRALVLRAFPLIQAIGGEATMDLRIGTRDQVSSGVDWTDALPPEPDGTVSCRAEARFHRVRLEWTGRFDKALGVALHARAAGLR